MTRLPGSVEVWVCALSVLGVVCLASPRPACALSTTDAVSDAGATDPAELFRLARNEFIHGQYEQAIIHLTSLIYPIRLGSEDDLVEARRLLGISYYLTQRYEDASEEFSKLLYTRPEFQMDPFFVAPPIIELFEAERERLKPQLDALMAVRQERKAERDRMRAVETGTTIYQVEKINYYHRSPLLVWLPFGLGQFQNGQNTLGTLLAASQGLCAATAAGTYVASQILQATAPTVPGTQAAVPAARPLRYVNWAAIGVFAGLWLSGSLAAWLDYEPVSIQTTSQRIPVAPRDGKP